MGYIRPNGETDTYSFKNDCVPLFKTWATDLADKVRQVKRTHMYKQELLEKTAYMDKIDLYG